MMKSKFIKQNISRIKKKFLGIGWRSKVIFKRATAYISINKLVVDGCDLEKGKELHSYLAEDENERKIIVTYVDGKKGNSS